MALERMQLHEIARDKNRIFITWKSPKTNYVWISISWKTEEKPKQLNSTHRWGERERKQARLQSQFKNKIYLFEPNIFYLFNFFVQFALALNSIRVQLAHVRLLLLLILSKGKSQNCVKQKRKASVSHSLK